jgi:nicotinamidase-related amidase
MSLVDERIEAAKVEGGMTVTADPYPWPFDGDLRPANTALIVIDMQTDFCGRGGYVDSMGYDISLTRAPIEPIRTLLGAMRGKGYTIIHTREATSRTFPTCPPTSAGGRSGSAPASATRVRRDASSSGANRAGRSSPNWRRSPAKRSSTSPARAPSPRPTSS